VSKTSPFEKPLCLVLGYHEIAPLQGEMRRSLVVSPVMFAAHMAYLWMSGWHCVRLEDLASAMDGTRHLPTRAFAITFDDGYVGIYQHAVPLLRRFQYTATIFVPSALVGQRGKLDHTAPVDKMDAVQLRRLCDLGYSVGSHTRTHADLPLLSDDELRSEIVGARDDLEALVDRSVSTFCYPFGHYSPRAVEIVQAAGHTLACSTEYGRVYGGSDRFLLPRVAIGDNLSLPKFIYRLRRAGSLVAPVGGSTL